MRALALAPLLASVGCTEVRPCTPGAPRDVDPRLVVALTDRGYASGAVAFQDGDGSLEPPQLPAGGDPIVRVAGDRLYVVDRGTADAVSAYALREATCPLWQTALEPGTNVHDLVVALGSLWLPTFGSGELLELDPDDGAVLAAHAPEVDGPVTLDRAVRVGERLWVADQRFSLGARHPGRLLPFDLAQRRWLDPAPAGPNPRIRAGVDGALWVLTGYYAFEPEAADVDRRDGALHRLDPGAGRLGPPLLTEAALDADLHTLVDAAAGPLVVAIDADARSQIHCLDAAVTTSTPGPVSDGWFVEGVAVGHGVVFAQRSSLIAGDALSSRGLLEVDPAACAAPAGLLATEFEPYDLAAGAPAPL